jgi:hypothetical protein
MTKKTRLGSSNINKRYSNNSYLVNNDVLSKYLVTYNEFLSKINKLKDEKFKADISLEIAILGFEQIQKEHSNLRKRLNDAVTEINILHDMNIDQPDDENIKLKMENAIDAEYIIYKEFEELNELRRLVREDVTTSKKEAYSAGTRLNSLTKQFEEFQVKEAPANIKLNISADIKSNTSVDTESTNTPLTSPILQISNEIIVKEKNNDEKYKSNIQEMNVTTCTNTETQATNGRRTLKDIAAAASNQHINKRYR